MNKTRLERRQDCPVWLGVCALRACAWFALLGFLLCLFSGTIAAEQQGTKKVLIMFSFSRRGDQRGEYLPLNELKSRLQKDSPWPIDFDVEYIEGRRLDDKEYEQVLTESLGHTYKNAGLDLVLIQSYAGLQFAAKHHDELFPGVPIVFLDVDPGSLANQKIWPGVTGVTATTGIRESVDLALHLHPNADTVAIITANSVPDRYFLSRIHAELLRYQARVREIDLVGLPTDQLLEKVAALPPQTVVFFQLAAQESSQPAMGTNDLLAWVAQRRPTYSIFPFDVIGDGGVGGATYDWDQELSLVDERVKRLLAGERPENIPVVNHFGVHPFVDWHALQRWDIPLSALPRGSVIMNRPPSIWQQYRNYIFAAIGVIVAQALLIIALLWQRARKRKTEAILRESEKRFRVMADATPSLIWMCDTQGKITYLNEQRLAFTGPDPDAGYGDTWVAFIHPDDVKGVLDALWHALRDQRPFSKEYRLHRNDGSYRWMFDVASPRVNGDGSFAGFIGSAIDVTDQKVAQDALKNVSGQLIEAQEKERTRIARDLHDDICQRLALLSMELEQAKRAPGSFSTTKELEEIRRHCSEIAGDVQSLSHELHSTKLDYLGVVAAVRSFCREFSQLHGVVVDFTDKNVPPHLPKDISLCIFRVAQEALHNAVKYSGVDKFTVDLNAIPGEVRLQVTDAGKGFNIEAAKKNRGLGLVSMQERVHLVRGRFSIESKPGKGTKILVFVPLIAENELASEDGDVKDTASMQQTS